MEEIIASISRIIAEDGRPSDRARPNAAAPDTSVLELTEAIAADGSVRRLASASGTSAGAEPGAEIAPPAGAAKRIEPEPPAPVGATAEAPERSRERILSPATSEAAATAFARLGAIPRERRPAADLSIGEHARTLEDIVRDSLRPLLQGWLDEHLPGIVERLVREAITRVVAEAELR
ncbi:MAG TPA: DUF2497 domain-containing protein [Stellaceae bacterium]|jgi:hypothetical protein